MNAPWHDPGGLPVLRADGLERSYRIDRGWRHRPALLRAVDDVSFSLPPGKTLAVVGESGCGKSTLSRLAAMIEPPTAGRLSVDGIDVATARGSLRRQLRLSVQMIFQDPAGSLNPRQRIASIVGEPLTVNARLGAGEQREKVEAMLGRVGLAPNFARRFPHMLSGGQRQRVAIARALILRPKLVIADEPTSALDVSIQAQVLNLLVELQAELKLAYLLVSHDLMLVRHLADEVLVLYLGRIAEHGPTDTIFDRPRHPYTRVLIAAAARTFTGRWAHSLWRGEPPSPINPPGGCAFHPRCPHVTTTCEHVRPALRFIDGRFVACHYAEAL
ncbi:MAG: dipeptide ABC transporter ATP-binding protein [Rhodospirillales bacterium]|nr:dipeptide ABC transporter ATP-binding protein [Rhodospirillales bacterium]